MTDREIEKALFDRVETLSVNLPVSYPNRVFNKPNDGKYIEVIHFPNDPIDYDWTDNATVARGLLQINVHWPRDVGTLAIKTVTDSIKDHFAKLTELTEGATTVLIDKPPAIGEYIPETMAIPIRISYRTT